MTTATNHDKHENDQIFSIEEAAAFCHAAIGTMRYWRQRGEGPPSFKIGRHVRYWRSELVRWLVEQARETQSRSPQRGAS